MHLRLLAFYHAFRGISTFFTSGVHPKLHAISIMLIVALGLYCQISKLEWLAIGLCIGLVICMEIVNTCIEELCNILVPKYDIRIKRIKDMAAAAVLIAAFTSLGIAGFIFLPKFFN